jgi:hypothetical protein
MLSSDGFTACLATAVGSLTRLRVIRVDRDDSSSEGSLLRCNDRDAGWMGLAMRWPNDGRVMDERADFTMRCFRQEFRVSFLQTLCARYFRIMQ